MTELEWAEAVTRLQEQRDHYLIALRRMLAMRNNAEPIPTALIEAAIAGPSVQQNAPPSEVKP